MQPDIPHLAEPARGGRQSLAQCGSTGLAGAVSLKPPGGAAEGSQDDQWFGDGAKKVSRLSQRSHWDVLA
jgi:hypothetical protein